MADGEAPRRPTVAARVLSAVIGFYQVGISARRGSTCRYIPSCSEYARDALADHGAWRGSYYAIRRLLRCHPFHAGGYDPVPEGRPRRGARNAADSGATESGPSAAVGPVSALTPVPVGSMPSQEAGERLC